MGDIMVSENGRLMRAAVIHEYGDSSVLKNETVAVPEPGDDEVLVKVLYTSVNPMDWKMRAGYMKDFIHLKMPAILGIDVAGVVEKTGRSVKRFKTGDKVFGRASASRGGSYAEYTAVKEEQLARMPNNLQAREAAGLPVVAGTAWGALFEMANLKAGQRVLITGASGGVGLAAVQFARNAGAHVIGTTSGANAKLVKEMGANEVVDYTKGDFSKKVHDVDVVLDTVGGDTLSRACSVLKRGGVIVSLTGPVAPGVAEKLGITAKYSSVPSDGSRLEKIAKEIEAGRFRIVIDREFPLERIGEAHVLSESRKAKGKIIIKI